MKKEVIPLFEGYFRHLDEMQVLPAEMPIIVCCPRFLKGIFNSYLQKDLLQFNDVKYLFTYSCESEP